MDVRTQACDTVIRIATNVNLPGPYDCECPPGNFAHSFEAALSERASWPK